jgi:hypothetical protein
MPRNGSGTYTLPANSWNPAVADTVVDPTDWNESADDLEGALTASLAKDGQTTATARIPFAEGIAVPAGSASEAGVSFDNDTASNTGLYSPSASEVGLLADGVDVLHSDAGDLVCPVLFKPEGGIEIAGGTVANLLLDSGTLSSDPNLDITIPAGFRRFQIILRDVLPDVAAPIELTAAHGASPLTAGYNYAFDMVTAEGGATSAGGSTGAAAIPLSASNSVGTSSTIENVLDIIVDTPTSGGRKSVISCDAGVEIVAGPNPFAKIDTRGTTGANGRITTIRVALNGGGDWSCAWALYGVLNS